MTVLKPRPSGRARPGLSDPLLLLLETAGGQLVDVEVFVSAGYAYDIRCEIVGEDGTLELLAPSTIAVRAAHAESLPIPPSFRSRFEAGVSSLESGRPVDVRLPAR